MFMIAIKLVKFYSNSNTWTLKSKRYLIYCTFRVFVANTLFLHKAVVVWPFSGIIAAAGVGLFASRFDSTFAFFDSELSLKLFSWNKPVLTVKFLGHKVASDTNTLKLYAPQESHIGYFYTHYTHYT